MDHSEDHLLVNNAVLHLWELKNDPNQVGQVTLCGHRDLRAKLQTIESYINNILVQEQVLAPFIGKNYHERLD